MDGDRSRDLATVSGLQGPRFSEMDVLVEALGAYELGGELGRGGAGIVVAGRHRSLGREVAIKRLPREFGSDPEARARFLAEARVLASLDHPHIVPIYDFVETGGVCALVMERLSGGSVWDRFRSEGFSGRAACAVVVAASLALHHAHRKGVLHRDVKPQNLMFSGDGVLKVTDFGIAKMLGGAGTMMVTQTGAVLGTPAYMAPEQVDGRELGPYTDVYAAGVVLYVLLCGQSPFAPAPGGAMAELYQRVHSDPVPLRERDARASAALAEVTARALARDPVARYATALEFAVAINEAATREWGAEWGADTDVVVRGSASDVARRAPSATPAGERPPGQPEEGTADDVGDTVGAVLAAETRTRDSTPLPRGDRVAQLAIPPVVGRVEELECLDGALDRVADGSPAAVALVGEAGMGKTRLLEQLQVRAEAQGHLVLTGRADEFERDLPFGVFVDALDDHLAERDAHLSQDLSRDLRAELAHVLPSLRTPAGDRTPVLQDERYRAHRAVRRLLERLARDRPLVVVLDDLHWADGASIELIAALLRRPPAAPVLLAVALRPRPTLRRLSAGLRDAVRAGTIEQVELGPLSAAEARDLIGDEVQHSIAEALYRDSGGNPFYLEELARAARRGDGAPAGIIGDEADPLTAAVRAVGVPDAVAGAIADAFTGLSAPTRALLNGAAVAGDPFELDLAAAAVGASEPEALAALDDLLEVGVVGETDVPRRFRFRHPLVRRAVYAGAPGGWRLGAHERVARALEASGADAAVRAHHVLQFARAGDQAAIALLEQAGQAAAGRAPASAARWYAGALHLLPAAAVEQRGALLAALATVLAATGRFAESHAALVELLDMLPSQAAEQRVRLTAACAGLEHLLGQHQDAHRRLMAALDELTDRGTPQAVALMIELAVDALYAADYEGIVEWATAAVSAARPLGDLPLLAASLAVLAMGAAFAGHTGAADAHRAEAAALLAGLPDAKLSLRLDAPTWLGLGEMYLDRYDDALAHLERGIAVGRATGQGQLIPLTMMIQGFAMIILGRPAGAAELLDGVAEAARLSGNRQLLCHALVHRSWAVLTIGDVDTAVRLAEESVELAGELDDSSITPLASGGLAIALLEAGEPARCTDVLVAGAGGAALPLTAGGMRCLFLERLVRAELACGRVAEAERAAAEIETAADRLGLGLASAMAHRARAAMLLADGKVRPAAEHALASAAAAERIGAKVEAACSRTLAGRALAATGQHLRARQELTTAAEELDACGARRYRDEALAELDRLSVDSADATPA